MVRLPTSGLQTRNFSERCKSITAKALEAGYLHRLFPDGKRVGRDLRAGDIYGGKGNSFGVNVYTGEWHDFAIKEHRGRDLVSLVAIREGWSQLEALEYMEAEFSAVALPQKPSKALPSAPTAGTPTRAWTYTDENGQELYQARRWEKEGYSKSCRLHIKEGVKQRVPLYLPEVLAAVKNKKPVFIVEGEPKADVLRGWGLTATTFAGGVNGYKPGMAKWFAGTGLVILPDADEPGRNFGQSLAADFAKIKTDGVKVIELPGARFEGYDIVNWVEDGGTFEKFAALVKKAPFAVKPNDQADGGDQSGLRLTKLRKTAETIPDEILNPGGVMAMVVNYIEKSTVANYPLFSMAASLALIGTLVGQKVMTETGLRTNLYIFALAPSGTGKDAPLSVIPRLLLDACASDENLGPNHLASSAGLLNRLSAKPCQLLLLDEIGDLMGSLKNKNDVAKNDLPKLLKSLYSSTDRGEIKAYANSKNNVNIPWHHLSFYATGVPGEFWPNLSVSDVTGGFIARSLLFSLDILAPFPKEDVDIIPPSELVDAIKLLHKIERRHQGNLMTSPMPTMVSKSLEAKKAFTNWHKGYHDLQNKHRNDPDGRAAIYARVAENAHKVALIHAVSLAGDIPVQVGIESVELGNAVVPVLVREIGRAILAAHGTVG